MTRIVGDSLFAGRVGFPGMPVSVVPPPQLWGLETQGNITIAVSTSGSDTPTDNRPARIVSGDYSAYPFLTIQAAVDALPKLNPRQHGIAINIAAGSYAGFDVAGFSASPATLPTALRGLYIKGVRATFTPSTGPSSGTATSGSTRTMVLTGAGWTADNLVGKYVNVTAGTGAGKILCIAKNTTDTITFSEGSSPALDGTSQFVIEDVVSVITSAAPSGFSGVTVQGCAGYPRIEDLKVSAAISYGFRAAYSNTVYFQRCVAENVLFYGLYVNSCTYVNCAACATILPSGATGLQASNTGQVWCAGTLFRGGDRGCSLDSVLSVYAASGFYIRDCATYGIYGERCPELKLGTSYGVKIDNCATGVYLIDCGVWFGGLDVSNCSTVPIYLVNHVAMRTFSGTTGTGNGGYGIRIGGAGVVVWLQDVTPTITGALGDFTVDGMTAELWSSIPSVGDYVADAATGSRVVRAAT